MYYRDTSEYNKRWATNPAKPLRSDRDTVRKILRRRYLVHSSRAWVFLWSRIRNHFAISHSAKTEKNTSRTCKGVHSCWTINRTIRCEIL